MKLATLIIAGLVAVLAGCSDDSGTLGRASTSAAATPGRSAPVTTIPRRPAVLYEAWLVRDGHLYRAQREGQRRVRAVAARALAAVVRGPTPQEAAAGVSTAVRASDRPVVVDVSRRVATVSVGLGFVRGEPLARGLRVAQVVFTLTQYEREIRAVRFAVGGTAPGPTLTRKSLDRHLPSIVVDEPRAADATRSPLRISGTANVFEATVSIRILDATGRTIARTVTTATCGTGCRGDYSASLPYAVERTQNGTVEVFAVSMADGEPDDVVAVPVRLSRSTRTPSG